MKQGLQFGGMVIALALSAGMALPCAAQNRNTNRPPQSQQRPAARPAQRQGRPPQPPPASQRPQSGRPNADRPHSNGPANQFPATRTTEANGARNGGNRPPNAASESARQPNFNPNRPPNATSSQGGPKRYTDLTPAEKRSYDQYSKLPPQRRQEMREAAQNWKRLTPEQQNHIKNDVLPQWKQLPPDQQKAIRQRLGVLQNMPESARNQHLNDPNFTRGMSEEDKAMLRDLSHMHVGAPDPPRE